MNKVLMFLLLALLVVFGTGCNRLQGTLGNFGQHETTINFVIEDIRVGGQSGNVQAEGVASLPDGTRLTVSALRTLEDTAAQNDPSNGPFYAILDRQFATVEQGKWQASLGLRTVDANGSPFESWQFNTDLFQKVLSPSPSVLFTVALEPINFVPDLQETLVNAVINGGDSRVTYTSEGEPYLQISESLAIQIPSGTAVAGEDWTLTQINSVWQERSNYVPSIDDLSDTSQLPFKENDNLPLPAANMMQ
ncbi:MAG: hypothetical protein F6K42_33345 [Leptolyngbya sp. SIO1D8]|nr:hypothetical protein [Leptolyngbya sp. SIO1D8]